MVLEGTKTHTVRLQREKTSRYIGDEVGVKHGCLKVFGKFNRSVTKPFTVLAHQKNLGPIFLTALQCLRKFLRTSLLYPLKTSEHL